MEAVFYTVPSIMIVGVLLAATAVIRRSQRISRAWDSGLVAEGRCLRTYTTTSGGGDSMVRTHLHHVYEFTTRDGRTVRFAEEGGPVTTIQDDIVMVHYASDRPEHATALAPARGRLTVESGCLLAFFGMFIAFCIAFILGVHGLFSFFDEFVTP